MQPITPCLWFDTEGEKAAELYTSVFPNSKIVEVTRYGSAGPRTEGTVMTVEFELNGQSFVALNGGPDFTFSEAVSFQVACKTRTRSTTTGARSRRAARKDRAAGSRTASASPGRSSRRE
jgi:predicted 3-demethylubiquinone-9 3-methyltransferase (glyoxalase superfamily)